MHDFLGWEKYLPTIKNNFFKDHSLCAFLYFTYLKKETLR